MSDGSFNPVQQVDVGDTMAKILGIQRLKQSIQTGQYQQDSAQAASEQASASNAALQRLQDLTVNGTKAGKWRKSDGSFDSDAYQADATAVGGIYAQDNIKRMTDNANDLMRNQQSLESLNASQRNHIGTTMGALATKKDLSLQDLSNAGENLLADDPSPGIRRLTTQFLTHIPPNATPDVLREYARRAAIAGGNSADATAQSNPSVQPIQTQEGLTPVNMNPQAPGGTGAVGAPINNAPAPSIQDTSGGQKAYVSANGVNVLPSRAAPASASGGRSSGIPARPRTAEDDAPGPNAPRAAQDAYANATAQAQADMKAARDGDANYGTSIHVSNVIRKLGKDTTTGPGSDVWHTMLAGVPGAVSQTANNAGADYQVMGSMLDRQAALARQSMGLPATNAGAADSQNIAGNTQFAPQALATKNNLTQALTEGAHQYRQGLEKVGGFTTQPSPNAVNKYKQEWTANFDPNVYRAIRAHDENDTDELNALRKELGPNGFKALSQKASNLISLSNTGHLPQ